jgi:hypothetical protein
MAEEVQATMLPNDPIALTGYILGMLAYQFRNGDAQQITNSYVTAGSIAQMMLAFRQRMEDEGFPKFPLPPLPREHIDKLLSDKSLRTTN